MKVNRIARVLPGWLKEPLKELRAKVVDVYAVQSYSQEGEDRILERIFGSRELGFYVDVGAHHPRRFSSTCLFYRRGWHGINIEPNPEAIAEFRRERKRDVNLEMGIGDHEGLLSYYVCSDPAYSSFDKELTETRVAAGRCRLLGVRDIPICRLDTIFRKHLPIGVSIDFMNVDVAGELEMAVLRSNDWEAFRPEFVLVGQVTCASVQTVLAGETSQFMQARGYELLAKSWQTMIFRLKPGL